MMGCLVRLKTVTDHLRSQSTKLLVAELEPASSLLGASTTRKFNASSISPVNKRSRTLLLLLRSQALALSY